MKPSGHGSEVESKARFSAIRYAQCWEDADILLAALKIEPGDRCLAIASAGDNAFSMVSQGAGKVFAIDLNPAQLACVELRKAAYQALEHGEFLRLLGSRGGNDRQKLYQACRPFLPREVSEFWDQRPGDIEKGIASAGKFENYFRLFRDYALRLVHDRKRIHSLLEKRESREERHAFYEQTWNNWRWRRMFQLFFSRYTMGRLGRDPSFFDYVDGSVADRILERTRHALVELEPSENPYLHWILTGSHGQALPHALREENFDGIARNAALVECRLCPLEAFLRGPETPGLRRFNLSDIFEYMSPDNYHALLRLILEKAGKGARLAYWNMLAPRSRPESMAGELVECAEAARSLHLLDKAFFYSRFVVEEVAP